MLEAERLGVGTGSMKQESIDSTIATWRADAGVTVQRRRAPKARPEDLRASGIKLIIEKKKPKTETKGNV